MPRLAEEIWQSVREWYKERGQNVPIDEAKICLKWIAEEKMDLYVPSSSAPSKRYISGVDWKAYWAKKKAKGWVPKKK